MKKLSILLAFMLGGLSFQQARAQVHVSINIGSQPVWGPVGYDYVEYYYLPDIDVFYYVPGHVYYYEDHGRWISAGYLPPRYRGYDLYSGYKVVINNDPRPYYNIVTYRTRYAPYKGRHDQRIIRYSDDRRYWEIKDHPRHDEWKGDREWKGERDKGWKGDKERGKGRKERH